MSMRKKTVQIIILLIILFVVLMGALVLWRRNKSAPVPQPLAETRLKVVTTILPLYLTAREVGGSLVDVVNLIPLTAQPHGYLLTEEDISNLEGADIVVTSGTAIDAWADEALLTLDLSRVSIIPIAKRLKLEPQLPLLAQGKPSGEADPHFWLDPGRMILAVSSMRDAISDKDPQHKDQYWVQTSFVLETLGMIDRDFRERFKGVASKAMVSSHLSMAHFISSFSLEWVGSVVEAPGGEPSIGHVNALVNRMRRDRVRAVFGDSENDVRAKEVAQQAQVPFVVFNTLETASTTAIESYETVIRRNMMGMSQALGYEPSLE